MGALLQPPLPAYMSMNHVLVTVESCRASQKVSIRRCNTYRYLLHVVRYRRLLRVSVGEGANGAFAPPGALVAAGEDTIRCKHKA